MHIETVVLVEIERQVGKKPPMMRIEPCSGPLDGPARERVHRVGVGHRRRVVVALDRQCAIRHHFGCALDDPGRIGAIPDEISQQDVLVRTGALRIGEACGERFAVGMNIGKQRR